MSTEIGMDDFSNGLRLIGPLAAVFPLHELGGGGGGGGATAATPTDSPPPLIDLAAAVAEGLDDDLTKNFVAVAGAGSTRPPVSMFWDARNLSAGANRGIGAR